MNHINLKIYGKVQNIGFRFNAKYKAEKLGIKGFIKNEPDGSVYLEAEGEEENLEKFIQWCNQGPEFARVKRVEKNKGKLKKFSDFEIRY